MAHTLIRFLADGRSQWLGADGHARDGLPPADPQAGLTVLVPTEDVLLLDAPRVARTARQLDQALPYAIEEQLAAPVEQQHVAWAPAADAGRVRVAVVARDCLDGWLSRLRAAGLEPDVMLPDALALPALPGRAALLSEDGRALLRLDDGHALAGTGAEMAALAPMLPADVDAWQVGAALSPLPTRDLRRLDHALPALAARAATPALNLLQGPYAPRRRASGVQRAWRWGAVLAAAAIALWLLGNIVDRQKLAGRVAAQENEMAELYRRAVPGASNADNPAQQLQSVLAAQGLGRGDAAIDLLGAAAPALAADARVSLEALEYRDGRLELTVQAADVAGLDALRQRLADAGLPAEITGSTPGTLGVQGRLRIGGAP